MQFIELFAGAGGLALGLEKAGFAPIALIEKEKNAVETLKLNRPHWNIILEDISKIAYPANISNLFGLKQFELDLLSGGVPCQAFSYAGKKLGLNDPRGTLFYYYAIFLQTLKPKVFLFENVKGLLTHDKGRTYNTIIKIFQDSGYETQIKILNALDYGVAQKRERLIIIGIHREFKDKIKITFPQPSKQHLTLKDVLNHVPQSEGASYSNYKKQFFKLIPQGGYWKDLPINLQREYLKSCYFMEGGRTGILRRMSLDEPSLTILTTPSQKQSERCHPLFDRPFTVRENARIQSFPDDWKFAGSMMSKYKQIGNAVPVNLAYEIGKEIKKGLIDFYAHI